MFESHTAADMRPVSLERLAVSSAGRGADALKARMNKWRAAPSPDAQTLLEHGFYKPLLEWAETHAWDVHGVATPWRSAGS